MNNQKFTTKAQQALLSAQNLAAENSNSQLEALHLLYSLCGQEESAVRSILNKLGADINTLKKEIQNEINRLPKLSGGGTAQISASQEFAKILSSADKEASRFKDEYISAEHLFLALIQIPSSAKKITDKFKINYDTVLKILAEVSGSSRITDQEPESKFQALKKFNFYKIKAPYIFFNDVRRDKLSKTYLPII